VQKNKYIFNPIEIRDKLILQTYCNFTFYCYA